MLSASAGVTMLIQKTKTVSFRLSDKDYRRLHEACLTMGVRSISELARSATQRFVSDANIGPIDQEILDLRTRVQALAADIQELAEKVQMRAQ